MSARENCRAKPAARRAHSGGADVIAERCDRLQDARVTTTAEFTQ